MQINKPKEQLIFENSRDYKDTLEEIKEINKEKEARRLQTLYEVAIEGSKRIPYEGNDFYLVLVLTNDPTQDNKPIDRIFVRLSCPTPGYNQRVYKWHKESSTLEYLWTIPKAGIYRSIMKNINAYLNDKRTKLVASWVMLMESGELLKWVKKENGEKPDAVIRVNQAPVEH